MPNDVVGKLPEFINDSSSGEKEVEEVKEPVTEEVAELEKETPSELPAEEEKPAEVEAEPQPSDDTKEIDAKEQFEKTVKGLRQELVNKHKEIAELRGQKREIVKQEELIIQQKVDDLKDLNSQDIELIERIMRAKGMMTKDEFQRSTYDQAKNEELNKFLDKYPEYKPENDPGDLNWNTLEKEIGLYKMPSDPRQIQTILERSHKQIARIPSDRNLSVQKRQMRTAGVGGGGNIQRSSAQKSSNQFTASQRAHFEKGGWSEAEISEMEQNLPIE